MRNLKKVLSLALAMVMLLGMMVVGASAADDYLADVPEESKEAMAVMNAIEVIQGGDKGADPDGNLTRAMAARILCSMVSPNSSKIVANETRFADVNNNAKWAIPFVAYCDQVGLVSGDGKGNFNPNGNVTYAEFATMLVRALGYDAKNEKFGDASDGAWYTNALRVATKAGVAITAAPEHPLTRAEAAQMAFQALTSNLVEYTGMNVTAGDVVISSPATARLHDITKGNFPTYDNKVVTATTPIRFCEEYFPYLKLDKQGVQDGFGHTAAVWKYRGAEIKGSDTTVKPDYVTNTKVLQDTPDWAKTFSMKIVAGTKIYINGYLGTSFNGVTYSTLASITENGRLVEVYLSESDLTEIDKIVVTDTALATVYSVESDGTIKVKLEKTNLEKADANKGYFVQGGVVLSTTKDKTEVYGDAKVGDVVLVKGYSSTTPVIGAPKHTTTLTSVEKVEEKTAFVSKKTYSSQLKASYLTVKGDDHDYVDAFNVVAEYAVDDFEPNAKGYDSILYLDEYQNIMKAVMGVDPNATTDYLIAVAETYKTLLDGKVTDMVKGVISNGETVDWPLKDKTTAEPNTLYTYKLENDRYELTPVTKRESKDITDKDPSTHVANLWDDDHKLTINFKSTDVLGKQNANKYLLADDVKFIFVYKGEITVASGRQTYDYKNASVLAQALRKSNTNDYQVRAVFIMDDPDIGNIEDLIYVHSSYRNNTVIKDLENGKQVKQYGYNAYDSDTKKFDEFLGAVDSMAGQFIKKDLDQNGAYKNNNTALVVKNHTLLPAGNALTSIAGTDNALWVTNVNGKKGDAFTLSDGKGTTLNFLSSGTKVRDLSDCGRNISTVAQLNEAVNDGYSKTQVAVIYNKAEGDGGIVYLAKTVFVTKCEKGSTSTDTTTPSAGANATGTDAGANITVTKLNTMLADGNVIITDDYTPAGAPNDSTTIDIPANTQLTVQGDFDATNVTINFQNSTSKLAVTGELKVDSNLPKGIVEAGSMVINASSNVDIASNVTVDKDLTITGGNTATIKDSSTVTVGNILKTDTSASKLVIKGTMKINGTEIKKDTETASLIAGNANGVTPNITITVLSIESLHIFGYVKGTAVKIVAGSGSDAKENGKVEIKGTLTATFIDKNIKSDTISTPTQEITNVATGATIQMSQYAKLTTKEFNPTNIALAAGAEITLAEGTKADPDKHTGSNIPVTDANGKDISNTETTTTIVIGAPVGTPPVGASDGSATTVPTEGVTSSTTESTVESTPPITVDAIVVYDGTSWDNAVKAGYCPVAPIASGERQGKAPLWEDFKLTDGATETAIGKIPAGTGVGQAQMYNAVTAVTSFPWLLAKVTVAAEDGLPADTVITAVVKKGETQVGTGESTYSTAAAKGAIKTLHWDMAKDRSHDHASELTVDSKNLTGTYTVEVNWTVNGAAVKDQTPQTATASYNVVPEIITENYTLGGQKVTVDNKNRTIKIDKAIDLYDASGEAAEIADMPADIVSFVASMRPTFKKIIVLEINKVEPWADLQVAYPTVPGSESPLNDNFSAGKTYAVFGVMDPSNPQTSFQVILSGKAETFTHPTEKLVLGYTIEWASGVKTNTDPSSAS